MVGCYVGLILLFISSFIGWRIREKYKAHLMELTDYVDFMRFAKQKLLGKKAVETDVFGSYVTTNKHSAVKRLYSAVNNENEGINVSAATIFVSADGLKFWRDIRTVNYLGLDERLNSHLSAAEKALEMANSEYEKFGTLASKLGVLAGCFLFILVL